MTLTAGVDIGSLMAKAVIVDAANTEVLASVVQPTGWQPAQAGAEVLAWALQQASIERPDLDRVVATGYGRVSLADADERLTEISCLARGIHHLLPEVRTAIDIGGQDSKIITLDEAGNAGDFALNDRCAAGTGRFLEVMADALGIEISDLGKLSLKADHPARFSSVCTVFAESEVVGLLAAGESRENIAAGLSGVIAHQIGVLLGQVQLQPPVALVGGVAQNRGVCVALEKLLALPMHVPDQPQTVCALGAALWAMETMQKGQE